MNTIEYVKTTKTVADIKKLGVTLDEVEKNFTDEEKQLMEKERKYYETLVAMQKMRKAKGFTQQKLSEISGVPRTTIAKIEAGNRNVTIDKLMTIADAMDTTLVLEFKT